MPHPFPLHLDWGHLSWPPERENLNLKASHHLHTQASCKYPSRVGDTGHGGRQRAGEENPADPLRFPVFTGRRDNQCPHLRKIASKEEIEHETGCWCWPAFRHPILMARDSAMVPDLAPTPPSLQQVPLALQWRPDSCPRRRGAPTLDTRQIGLSELWKAEPSPSSCGRCLLETGSLWPCSTLCPRASGRPEGVAMPAVACPAAPAVGPRAQPCQRPPQSQWPRPLSPAVLHSHPWRPLLWPFQ